MSMASWEIRPSAYASWMRATAESRSLSRGPSGSIAPDVTLEA
jgi:hypothetical protein